MKTLKNPLLSNDERICEIVSKIEPCLVGYPRTEILLALTRTIAMTLGPADAVSRRVAIECIPHMIGDMLREMDTWVNDHVGT